MTDNMGWGVFATKKIKQDEVIAVEKPIVSHITELEIKPETTKE